MKTILSLIFFAVGLSAQSNVTITLPATSAQESPINMTILDVTFPNLIVGVQNWAPNGNWPNSPGAIPANTTLAAAVTSATNTSISLTSAANLQPYNGLQIGSETLNVVSVSGNTVTVTRGTIGTTAATYTVGTPVTVLRVGWGTAVTKAADADLFAAWIARYCQGTVSTACSAITTNQGTVATTAAGGVQ